MHTNNHGVDDSRTGMGGGSAWLHSCIVLVLVESAPRSKVDLRSVIGLHGIFFEVVTLLHHLPEEQTGTESQNRLDPTEPGTELKVLVYRAISLVSG